MSICPLGKHRMENRLVSKIREGIVNYPKYREGRGMLFSLMNLTNIFNINLYLNINLKYKHMKQIRSLLKFIPYVLMFLYDAIYINENIENFYAKTQILASKYAYMLKLRGLEWMVYSSNLSVRKRWSCASKFLFRLF